MQQKTIYDMVYMGEDILNKRAANIVDITPEITALAGHMQEIMYKSGGCGIAAPQVGVAVRMCIIDCEWDETGNQNPFVLINPEIVERSEETEVSSEGCLSFPGVTVQVERSVRVVVEAKNLDGALMRYTAERSLMSRCLQHEIDHLDGIVMLDHIGPIARMNAIAKVKVKLKEASEKGISPWELKE